MAKKPKLSTLYRKSIGTGYMTPLFKVQTQHRSRCKNESNKVWTHVLTFMSYKRIKKNSAQGPPCFRLRGNGKNQFHVPDVLRMRWIFGWNMVSYCPSHHRPEENRHGTTRLDPRPVARLRPDLGVSILSQEARSGAKLLLPEFCC